MAKRDNVSAPPPPIAPSASVPPTPTPTPTPTPPANDVLLGSSTLDSTYNIDGRAVQLGTVVAGAHTASGLSVDEWNALSEEDRDASLNAELSRLRGGATNAPTGVGDPDVVQPEIGGEPIAQTAQEERVTHPGNRPDHLDDGVEDEPDVPAMAEEAFATLKDEPFDPATNLGDWDGDGKAGGSVPAVDEKENSEKTNAELGTEVGTYHAKAVNDGTAKPKRSDLKALLDAQAEGKLPNGMTIDDEFWTAYDQAFDREVQQLAADELSDEDRLRRVEKALGLLSPRD